VSKGVGFRYRGACEGGANPLSELDHALAMIGSAHWTENFSTSAHPRNRRQSTSPKWQLWGIFAHPPRGQPPAAERRNRLTTGSRRGFTATIIGGCELCQLP